MNRRTLDRMFDTSDDRKAIILQYHSVSPRGDRSFEYVHPSLSISLDNFDKQMGFVRHHFKVVSLGDLLAHVNGDKCFSKTPVAITFDDGYRDNYLYAFPVLLNHGLTATFYLTTECIGTNRPLWTSELRYLILHSRRETIKVPSLKDVYYLESLGSRMLAIRDIKDRMIPMGKAQRQETLADLSKACGMGSEDTQLLANVMMDWKEAAEMRRYGMEFGAHTLSHPSLPHIPSREAKEEVMLSKKILEERFSEPIAHFSYPNPGDRVHSTPDTAAIIKGAGYVSAATSIPGYVCHGNDNMQLKRKGIYELFSKLPEFYCWIRKEAFAGIFPP